MVILSVDFGRARTGIAICDPGEMLASPVTVINEKYVPNLVQKVASLAAEKKAELIVVGLPVNMDGSEGESAQNARQGQTGRAGDCDRAAENRMTCTIHNRAVAFSKKR